MFIKIDIKNLILSRSWYFTITIFIQKRIYCFTILFFVYLLHDPFFICC